MPVGIRGNPSGRTSLRLIEELTYLTPEADGFYRLELQFSPESTLPEQLVLTLQDVTGDATRQNVRLNPVDRRAYIAVRLKQTHRKIRLEFEDNGVALKEPVVLDRCNETVWRTIQFGKFLRRTFRRPGGPLRLVRQALGHFKEEGVAGIVRSVRELTEQEQKLRPGKVTYARWIKAHDFSSERDTEALRRKLSRLAARPVFQIVVPVSDEREVELAAETIASVRAQIYADWCLIVTGPPAMEAASSLAQDNAADLARSDRVSCSFSHATLRDAVNSASDGSEANWLLIVGPGVLLRKNALAEMAIVLAQRPDAGFLYADEDRLSDDGVRSNPHFKPDFSRELLHSSGYVGSAFAVRLDTFRESGKLAAVPEETMLFDLVLRVTADLPDEQILHVPKVLFHLKESPTAVRAVYDWQMSEAGAKVLSSHLARTGLPAEVELAVSRCGYRVRPKLPEPHPLVSLVIATRDNADLLKGCIASLLEKTNYSNFELIIIDNDSSQPEAIDFLASVHDGERVRVVPYPHPFNYSKLANLGVAQARGSLIGLLNNDMEVIEPDWLSEMVSWAARPEIGCVGAKLYYSDSTIQHAGVILGPDGIAGHAFRWFKKPEKGYFNRAVLTQNLSAVTGACMLVKKSTYDQVGGFDEKNLTVAYNDVDFCLKVGRLGLKHVWTPYAELFHFESKSRGIDNSSARKERHAKEFGYMMSKWKREIESDPYYSVNFSRQSAGYDLRE